MEWVLNPRSISTRPCRTPAPMGALALLRYTETRMESPTSQEQGHAGERLCEACQLPLSPRQRPGARFHGGACRAVATGARRRAAALAQIDALAGELAQLRIVVEQWVR
jgi:hypothetical protein